MRDLISLMEATGFTNVEYVKSTGVTTSRFTVGATFRARKPGEPRSTQQELRG